MAAIETRNFYRDSLYVCGEMTLEASEAASPIKVRNLSARGMMAVCDEPVRLGQQATIGLRNIGTVNGTILWVHGHRFGITFEQEIDPKLVRQQVFFEDREAPRYARSAMFPKPHGSRHGNKLPV